MTAPLTVTGAVSMAGGTLSAGSSALQAGSIALTGGTLKMSSGTTTVGGSFTNTGGTLTANGGSVVITGAGTLSPGSSSFNDLTINASGKAVTLGSALLVGGDLAISAGTLAAGAWDVNVSGSWTTAGTFTSSGTVTLSGTSSTETITSGGSSFGTLVINGSGGTYTLQDKLTTTGGLTLTAGTLATGSADVSVGGNLSVSAGAFTGGTGTVGITGNLAMTGGTYTGGAGSLTVGGNVTLKNAVTNGADPTLVGYWPLDDTASPAADSSGNGNTLTWSGTPTTTTAVPTAISFTDTRALAMTGTQYASSPVLSGIAELRPTTVTMSAWYKATSADTSGAEIVSGSNTYGLRITSTGVMVMKRISDNTSAADWIEYRVPLTNVLDGKWHQLVGEIVTGTGGGMSVYFDGAVASGNYWVNGTNGASQLSGSTSPTSATAATADIDWDANTETYGLVIGTNPSTTGYQFGKGCSGTACALDDVRVYNRSLTAAEVAALAHGTQPGGSTGVLALTGSATVTGTLAVQSTGTLTLNSGSSLSIGTALTVDGSLNATGATIQRALVGRYAFVVGSTASAAPALNINGLTVDGPNGNGMWINANTGASTTFTRFDKITFKNGTGGELLQIYAPSLNLNSNGCSFDNSTTYAVKLTGNGTTGGSHALFGNATCAVSNPSTGLCADSEKSDDDSNNDGTADHPSSNGAVVQFVRSAASDTAGTLIGYPTAAFDWSTYSYYATYVTFHDASNGSDVIYVRDQSGNALYSWTDPSSDETIVGTPLWNTSGGKHYVYVAANGTASNTGKVYRLVDSSTGNTSGSLALDTAWATSGVYSCTCTVKSNLSTDATNVYWAATTSTAQVLMGVKQSNGAKISTSWPVTTPANVTTSPPTLVTKSGTTTLYLGITSNLLSLAVTGTTFLANTSPGTITGRVTYGTSFLTGTSGT
ncbi:MAG TPA: LamG-like jellyroll fold domain-containing protein, partial [Polyangia bacterium]|nr:LamG-like jellyroll fold domain-containing protein [Polyangia bacterium]